MEERKFLSMTDAAKVLPIRPHVCTIWRWCRKGIQARNGEYIRLRHFRVGGRMFTTKEDLYEFFEKVAVADTEYFARAAADSLAALEAKKRVESRPSRSHEEAMRGLRRMGVID